LIFKETHLKAPKFNYYPRKRKHNTPTWQCSFLGLCGNQCMPNASESESECILKMCINAGRVVVKGGWEGMVTMPSARYLCNSHTHNQLCNMKSQGLSEENEKSKSICGNFSIRSEGSWQGGGWWSAQRRRKGAFEGQGLSGQTAS